LLRYKGFEQQRFSFVAAFDIDAARIGSEIGGVPVLDVARLEEEIAAQKILLAILSVPAEVARPLAKRLAQAGITGILNFAPVVLRPGGATCITNVDLASELQQLAFSVLSHPDPSPPLSDPPRSLH
jgi:redox-sensing transcriptional repressor